MEYSETRFGWSDFRQMKMVLLLQYFHLARGWPPEKILLYNCNLAFKFSQTPVGHRQQELLGIEQLNLMKDAHNFLLGNAGFCPN